MLTFYDAAVSGNTYKIRLLLKQLAIAHQAVRLDLFSGDARTEEWRARNPFGRVPYLEEEGFGLAESNAILLYLARGSRLLPTAARAQALVHQWMFFEQNQVEHSIGIPRILRLVQPDATALFEHYHPRAKSALGVLERHLASRQWLVGEAYSVADIALFGYTHLAPAAGHDLAGYPAVSAWIERFRAQSDFIELE